jgi:hypothetical protein
MFDHAGPEHLGDHEQAMTWLKSEHRVLLAALRQAADCGFDTHGWQLAWAPQSYLLRQGHRHDRIVVWQTALHARIAWAIRPRRRPPTVSSAWPASISGATATPAPS